MITLTRTPGGRILVLALLLANFALAAHGTLLNPGNTIPLRLECEPAGGHLVAVTNIHLTTPTFRGTLTSKVWADDPSNPWDGLTFAYRLTNESFCQDTLGRFAVDGFEDCFTDVSFLGAGVAPRTASRSLEGDQIAFNFLNRKSGGTVAPGAVSAWLIIQTDCLTWQQTTGIQVNSIDVTATAFGPTLVPEPSAFALAGMGATLFWLRRRVARR